MKSILVVWSFSFYSMSSFALTPQEATDLVKNSLTNTEIASEKSYCVHGTVTCRTMYLLRDKITKRPSPVFYDTFYSADRQVGSTCYFIPTSENPKQYDVLTDSVFDGRLAIDIISPVLANIEASPDFSVMAFRNLKSPVIGTTKYSLADMVQNENVVTLDGVTYDSADPSVKIPVHIDYFRANP